MIARWRIDARFGHKQAVIDSVKTWSREIGSQIGWTKDELRIASGSIGALESTIEMDVMVQDLTELNASRNKLVSIPAHLHESSHARLLRAAGTKERAGLRPEVSSEIELSYAPILDERFILCECRVKMSPPLCRSHSPHPRSAAVPASPPHP